MSGTARLLGLRLQGFKSFAERTVVELGPGISAVVGPNGSGKSNLVDALRWALGEQGRALRSRRSEDVIFAGSERRAALGMADVTLVVSNEDGLLPVDFETVELGRRLYRSGENEYLLNKQRIRLRDLIDLLDAAHLGDNAFLFIGQGMVDQALSLRPEERRPLFEEVAGVRRHERRRRRAEEQLAEAELNLTRVEDILTELRPQAKQLAARAEQEAQRERAGEEYARALVVSTHGRWHEAAVRLAECAASLEAAGASSAGATRALREAEAAAAALHEGLEARSGEARARREAHESARGALLELRVRDARLVGELEALGRDRQRLATERESAAADLEQRRRELALPVPGRDMDAEAALADAERALREAQEELSTLRSARAAQGGELAALRRAEAARHGEMEQLERRLAETSRGLADEETKAESVRARSLELDAKVESLRSALEAHLAETRAIGERRESARAAADAREGERRVAAEAAAAAGAKAAALRSRLDALRGRLDDEERRGIGAAAKARGGRALGASLDVEPGFRTAVEAALGGAVRGWVLSRSSAGELAGERGTVVLDEAIGSARDDAGAVDRLMEAVSAQSGGRLADALRSDPSGRARSLLARAAWVPELPAALELQPLLPAGWVVVTMDGSTLTASGILSLGRDESLLERRAELSKLEVDAADAEQAAAAAKARLAEMEAASAEARRQLEEDRKAETAGASRRRSLEDEERAAARAAEAAHREAAWHEAQATRLRAERDRLDGSRVTLDEAAKAAQAAVAAATAEAGATDGSAERTWEARAEELRRRRDQLAAEHAERERVRRAAEDRRARAEASAAFAEERLARVESSEQSLAERDRSLAAERDALAADLATAQAREEAAATAVEEHRAVIEGQRNRLATAEAAVAQARERTRAASDRTRQAEVAELEARLAHESVREQVRVELASLAEPELRAIAGLVTLDDESAEAPEAAEAADTPEAPEAGAVPAEATETAEPAAAEHDGVELVDRLVNALADRWAAAPPDEELPAASRLQQLRRRYHALGAANPFALEEYEALKERLGSLDTQASDLTSAIGRTRSLIAELETLIETQFAATFSKLEHAFDQRFAQLFGGGYAKLVLTDPNDLAATGVEIFARPPGKKAQNLASFSGGERTLTAVALLLAMLEVRPVPFCVLDEVDAALDEANVGRFVAALRDLSERTQFIVITHNRGTIEGADALYGITVGDDAVSRVMSLRLEEAKALASERGRHRATEPALD